MQRYEFVIIGGGVVGCSILYHLARSGRADALLVEKTQLTAGSTWHAAANGNTFNGSPMMAWSMKRTFDLWDEIEAESGQAITSHKVGGIMVARTEDRMDELHRLLGIGRRIGVTYQMLTPDELKAHWPMLDTSSVLGALYDPNGGHVDPYGLTHAYARAARARGAEIRQQCPVTGLRPQPDGSWIVETPQGEIQAGVIINAAGMYADEIAQLTGARLPMTNMAHHYLISEPIKEMQTLDFEPPVLRDVDIGVYARREAGGILFGIYEDESHDFGVGGMPADFSNQLLPADIDRLLPNLEQIWEALPCLAEAGIKSTVNGPFVFTPDVRPLVGWMPGQTNHFCAAGFLAGIAMSGGFGQLIGEWLTQGTPSRDLSGCDLARFGDWAIGDFALKRAHDAYATRYKQHFPNEEVHAGRPVRTSPMFERYRELGACFGMSDGWERPLWFGEPGTQPRETPTFRRSEAFDAIAKETMAVATDVALGDLLTFSQFVIEGPDAETFLRRALPGRIPKEAERMSLSPLVDKNGNLVGDMTILRVNAQRFRLFGSGGANRIHERLLQRLSKGLDVSLSNRTDETAGFVITGPNATQLAQALLGESLPAFFRGKDMFIGDCEFACTVLRLSYVGEVSYEIHCAMSDQVTLHDEIIAANGGMPPAMFGARALNTMRIEKGFARTGEELNVEITPFEAGMGGLIDEKRDDFHAASALQRIRRNPLRYRMVKFLINTQGDDPHGGEAIFAGSELAGWVSSATYGTRVKQSLGIGFLFAGYEDASNLETDILGNRCQITLLSDPAYDPLGQKPRE